MTHEKTGQGCEAPRPALDCVAVAADTPENKTGPITSQARPSWRDVLLVHQAADLFKFMTDDELMALGKDIEENGLKVPVVFIEVDDSPLKMTTRVARKTVETSIALLDGRNRLDALEARGWVFESVSPHISQVSRCGGWVRAGGWFRTWPARVPAAVGGWAGSTMVSLVAGLVESRSQPAAALHNRA